MNSNNVNPKSQTLNLIWLVYLMTTVSLPFVSYISNQSKLETPTENISVDLNSYLSLCIGVALFIISHFVFKSVSGKPIAYQKYVTPFIISLTMAEVSTLFGFVYATTHQFDVFTYSLFALGFLAVLMKKPYTNLIAD